MIDQKSASLNIRINPAIKEALRGCAYREHRSVANMVEVLIIRYCQENGISIAEQSELFDGPAE